MTTVRISKFTPTGTEHHWCRWAVEIVGSDGKVLHRWPVETLDQAKRGKQFWEEQLKFQPNYSGPVSPWE